jgi:hypothetical protein
MKESYRKGPANHPGPESCEGSAKRKAALEALTGVYAGFVLSSEIDRFRVPTRSDGLEGNTTAGATSEPAEDPAESQTRACVEPSWARTERPCMLPEPPQGGGPAGEGDEL